jgi:hypothetical protein
MDQMASGCLAIKPKARLAAGEGEESGKNRVQFV